MTEERTILETIVQSYLISEMGYQYDDALRKVKNMSDEELERFLT